MLKHRGAIRIGLLALLPLVVACSGSVTDSAITRPLPDHNSQPAHPLSAIARPLPDHNLQPAHPLLGPTSLVTVDIDVGPARAMGLVDNHVRVAIEIDRIPDAPRVRVIQQGTIRESKLSVQFECDEPLHSEKFNFGCVLIQNDGVILGGVGRMTAIGTDRLSASGLRWKPYRTLVEGSLREPGALGSELTLVLSDNVDPNDEKATHFENGSVRPQFLNGSVDFGGEIMCLPDNGVPLVLRNESPSDNVLFNNPPPDSKAAGRLRRESPSTLLDLLNVSYWVVRTDDDGSFSIRGFCANPSLWIRWCDGYCYGMSWYGKSIDLSPWTRVKVGSVGAEMTLRWPPGYVH